MRVTAGMVARVRALAEPRWSPDGRLAGLPGELRRARRRRRGAGRWRPVPPADRRPGAQPTASYGGGILNWLDAETVIFVAPDGQLHALSVDGGPTRQLTRLSGRVSAPVASPDGRWIACMVTTKADQQIVVVDPKGEEWPRRVSREGDFVFDPSWSPMARWPGRSGASRTWPGTPAGSGC